ncbi:MAG: DMT family transporter [Proteobacteria bacterium]|nr:DMT family transporter [Pseudomonadota bacterium]
MTRPVLLLLTALAPAIWGSTYLVTTEFLPADMPLTSAAIRALPAGLLLLLIARELPSAAWIAKLLLLGALNFSLFWWLLFVAAYKLPGGVAATLGSLQPLIVIFASYFLLGSAIRVTALIAGIGGIAGVALLLLTPEAGFDLIGILAGFGGAASMAFGVVLTRKWQPPVSPLTFTAWQLVAGGLLLVPPALMLEPALPSLSTANILGYTYLSLIGGALTYILWFRGIAALDPNTISPLGFLSPASAVLLGWVFLSQPLGPWQLVGIGLVLVSIWLATRDPGTPSVPLLKPTRSAPS